MSPSETADVLNLSVQRQAEKLRPESEAAVEPNLPSGLVLRNGDEEEVVIHQARLPTRTLRLKTEILGFFRAPLVLSEVRKEREIDHPDFEVIEAEGYEVPSGLAKGVLGLVETLVEAVRLGEMAGSQSEKRCPAGRRLERRVALLGGEDRIAGKSRGPLRVRARSAGLGEKGTSDVEGFLLSDRPETGDKRLLVRREQQLIDELRSEPTPLCSAGREIGSVVVVGVKRHRSEVPSAASSRASFGCSRA